MYRKQRLFQGFSIGVVLGCIAAAPALADPFPLPGTTADRTAMEGTAPFLLPDGFTQNLITDRATLNSEGLPGTFGNWDMSAFSPDSRFVFIPAEVSNGAGVFRYDTETGAFVTQMEGIGGGGTARESDPVLFDPDNDEFVRFDPATLTPWGSVLTGEETTGGRVFEIVNAQAAKGLGNGSGPQDGQGGSFRVEWRDSIPAVAHEGLRFDSNGVLYFVDENNSGSIYKFVPSKPGDLRAGQTFVLSVNAFAANAFVDAAKNWDHADNAPYDADRFGLATWVPITDAGGQALTFADPFAFVTTTGGRNAADEVKGTPYGRPEDMGIGVLANGNEVAYVSITSENRVISIELISDTTAMVREFVNFDTVDGYTGTDINPTQNDPYTSPGPDTDTNFDDPDNIAIGPNGEVFIIEDEGPGDIWKATDANKDGVAESMGLWASLGVAGSEPTGLIRDPNNPKRYIVNIQHPASGNDALWEVIVP